MGAVLEPAEMDHSLVRGVADNLGALLEQLDPQQAIVVRRLLLRRDPQPDMVGVEGVFRRLGHSWPFPVWVRSRRYCRVGQDRGTRYSGSASAGPPWSTGRHIMVGRRSLRDLGPPYGRSRPAAPRPTTSPARPAARDGPVRTSSRSAERHVLLAAVPRLGNCPPLGGARYFLFGPVRRRFRIRLGQRADLGIAALGQAGQAAFPISFRKAVVDGHCPIRLRIARIRGLHGRLRRSHGRLCGRLGSDEGPRQPPLARTRERGRG